MSSKPASTYTQGHNAHVIASHQQRTVHNSAAFLLPYLAPHFSLLDIGCGPGTITIGLADILTRGKVTGIDLSPEVIDHAKAVVGARPNLDFETGNVLEGLKYPDNSFDVVYMHQTLIHVPKPEDAVREIRRVLKPGGILACRETTHIQRWPLTHGLTLLNTAMQKMIHSTGAPGPECGAIHPYIRRGGFEEGKMVVGAGTTVFQSRDERQWLASVQLARLKDGGIGQQYVEAGVLRADEVDEVRRAMEEWAVNEDAWYVALQAEILAWK